MKISEHPDFNKFSLIPRIYRSAHVRDISDRELEAQAGLLYGTRTLKDLEIEQFYALRKALVALPLAVWHIAETKAKDTPKGTPGSPPKKKLDTKA